MDVRLLFPSLYLGAVDLHGKEVALTIRRVLVEPLKTERGEEKKPVVYFEETRDKAKKNGTEDKEKRLVLNKTNAMAIAGLHGNEVDDWVGKKVTFYATKVSAFGKEVDAIRVKA